jgi:putative membrane protein
MQLGLIVGIIFAIGAVIFAMQNIASVTVSLGFWSFEGSLALVLLVALGLGALIAGLVSSPAMIRRQWSVSQLGRQITDLERKLADEKRRTEELQTLLEQARSSTGEVPPAPVEKPYVGLRALIAGEDKGKLP